MTEPDYQTHPEFVPEWDVYRDADGKPVTITWEQVRGIWKAYEVWRSVLRAEGLTDDTSVQAPANWQKSCLLGRMLIDGKPPTRTRPPVVSAQPRWDLLPGGDPFEDR